MSLVSATPAPLGVPSDNVMNLALLGKTGLALVVVLACVLVCGWLARRIGFTAVGTGEDAAGGQQHRAGPA